MKFRSIVLTLAAMLAVFALAACSSQPASTSSSSSSSSDVSQSSSTSAAQPSDGSAVSIKLDYNAGTGYEWAYEVSPEGAMELVSSRTADVAEEGVTGGPLRDTYTFRATQAGETTITFNLVRPWEEDEEPAETQVFTFTVNDDLTMSLNPYKSEFDVEPDWDANA